MAESGKLGEDGLQIALTAAEEMDKIFESAATAASVGFAVGAVLTGGLAAAVGLVVAFIDLMTGDESTSQALKQLQAQITVIRNALQRIDERMEELVGQEAAETNRQITRAINDLADEIRLANIDAAALGGDLERAVSLANRAGITADKFLRSDFDLWRWTDVVVDGQGALRQAPLRFKSWPTLPVYVSALLSWFAVREKVVRFGARERLDDDQNRIARHLAAVSVRPFFDKYAPSPDSTPRTITENIKWRIRGMPLSKRQARPEWRLQVLLRSTELDDRKARERRRVRSRDGRGERTLYGRSDVARRP